MQGLIDKLKIPRYLKREDKRTHRLFWLGWGSTYNTKSVDHDERLRNSDQYGPFCFTDLISRPTVIRDGKTIETEWMPYDGSIIGTVLCIINS
jgi:hypothetical protein